MVDGWASSPSILRASISISSWFRPMPGHGLARALLAEAKRISPQGLDLYVNTDNIRAIRFYEKQGFVIRGEAINWRSGAPVHKMSWRRRSR